MWLRCRRLVCFVCSTSAQDFNNSLPSEFGARVLIKASFCSKGHSVTRTTGSSLYFWLHERCALFLFMWSTLSFSPWIPGKTHRFTLRFLFPNILAYSGVKPFGPFLRSAHFTLIHLESNCLGLLILFSLKACLISHLLYFSPKSSGLLIYLTKSHPRLPLLSGYPEEPHRTCCRISLK